MAEFENETSRGVDEGSSSTSAPAATTTNSTLEVRVDPRMEPKPPKRRIEKVPLIMRRDEKTKGYFDPQVVSIGPYHHGKEELRIAKRIKPIVVELFISGSGRDMDEFRKNVLEIVDDARSYYFEGSTDMYSDVEFAEMMLLDGLFVAAFIESSTPGYGDESDDKFHNELTEHLGQHDLYVVTGDIMHLLENQLPFPVIKLLMSLKSKHYKLTEMMDKMLHSRWESRELTRQDKRIDDTKQPIHFLDYTWLCQNSQSIHTLSRRTSTRPNMDYVYSFKSLLSSKLRESMLGGVVILVNGILSSNLSSSSQCSKFLHLFSHRSFKYLSNHIAYEWTPHNPNNLPTMAFVNFMKSLINTIDDVKELRARNILFNSYTSDEEVVQLFNNIPTILMEDFSIYDEVKQKIRGTIITRRKHGLPN